MQIDFLSGEAWWGGAVYEGVRQPYTKDSCCILQLENNPSPNQCMPVLLSNKGRWLWRAEGFTATIEKGHLICPDTVELHIAPQPTLRGAYLDAMRRCFPLKGAPDRRLFSAPVYNSWIELTFNQTQAGVLKYAKGVVENDFEPGVLMIDDGWSPYYGRWRFDKEKFPDPASMINQLHSMGFTVMLWICPFVTPDTQEYRELEALDLLVKNSTGDPHIVRWWNGWSAALDLTLEKSRTWLYNQLHKLEELGIDGFKLDAGDPIYYPSKGDEQCAAWSRFGAQWPLNEFRAGWHAGGLPLMQRLCDKHPSWGSNGLAALVPCALTASLTGHPFVCPDMIGGGEYQSFWAQEAIDEELFLRWTEAACLMPVMQFSAAPWRVLSRNALAGVHSALALRNSLKAYLLQVLEECIASGEPMMRPLEYEFPGAGYECVNDQFMLGNRLLVALQTSKQSGPRTVCLPSGRWRIGESVVESAGQPFYAAEDAFTCGQIFLAWREE